MKCSAESAQKIVDLLMADNANICNTHGGLDKTLVSLDNNYVCKRKIECKGCSIKYIPEPTVAKTSKFCSRDCYDKFLERKRKPKKQKSNKFKGMLGPGKRLPKEVKEYLIENRHCKIEYLLERVKEKYGFNISTSTIYRAWRKESGGKH